MYVSCTCTSCYKLCLFIGLSGSETEERVRGGPINLLGPVSVTCLSFSDGKLREVIGWEEQENRQWNCGRLGLLCGIEECGKMWLIVIS